MIFDPKLVFCVIDTLFGGDGKQHFRIEGRDFSATEQRIIQRMMEVTLAEYAKAWGALFKFDFQYQRSEMHTQFANIATPSEIVVAITFNVEIGDSGGEIHLCFPYSSLEPIRDILYSSLQADGQEPDRRWVRQLDAAGAGGRGRARRRAGHHRPDGRRSCSSCRSAISSACPSATSSRRRSTA